MAYKTYVLTLNGSAQRLSTVLTVSTTGGSDDIPIRALILQPRRTIAAPIYIGDTSSVSSTVYGFSLPAASGGVPPAPFILGEFADAGPIKLSNFYVIGTNNEYLHIGIVPF